MRDEKLHSRGICDVEGGGRDLEDVSWEEKENLVLVCFKKTDE